MCIDLTSGLDLSNIDVSTVRLNESIAAAATVRQQDTLRLSFSRSDVHDVDQSQRLTITGRLTDGVGIRGAVQLE